MAQIDDFFMYENRVEGITDADYQRVQPYVEAAQAFAQTTYQSIYIIDYFRKDFLYVSDNPLFLCGHTANEARQKIDRYIADHPPVETFPRFYLVLLRQPIAPMEPDGMSHVYQM